MTDIVDAPSRSRMMSGIRGKNTKPEILVRSALFKVGFRFRLHRKDLPGAPDIVLPKWKVAIFVHGCFWHLHSGCANARIPATRTEFWAAKLGANVERDRKAFIRLAEAGWRVLVVWECLTRDKGGLKALPESLSEWIRGSERSGELSPPDMNQ